MSHYYYLYCLDCNHETESLNHGVEPFKKFINDFEKIDAALQTLISLGVIQEGDQGQLLYDFAHLPSDIYSFVKEHRGHNLVIRSEYPSDSDITDFTQPKRR